MTVSIKQRLALGISIIVITMAVLFIFYVSLFSNLQSRRKECGNLERELSASRRIIAAAKTIEKKRLLVNDKDISLAIDEFIKQCKLYKINISSLVPGKILSQGRYALLPVKAILESEYKELGMLLGSLEKLERSIAVIDSFKVAPYDESGFGLKAEIVINMYTQPERFEYGR